MYKLKIKELRKDRGLTQLQFAEIMNLNPVTVNRYENNKRFPDISTLIAIADYFDVPLDVLLDRSWPASHPVVDEGKESDPAMGDSPKNPPDFNHMLKMYRELHDKYGMALPLDELSEKGRERLIDYYKLVRNSEKYGK